MNPPRGHIDFSFALGRDGQPPPQRPAPGVGHIVFVAPYSSSRAAARNGSVLAASPVNFDTLPDALRIASGSVQVGPLTPGAADFALPLVDADTLHPDGLLESVPELAALWKPLRDLYHDQRAVDLLNAMLAEVEEPEALASPSAPGRAPGDASDATIGASDRDTMMLEPVPAASPATSSSEGEDALLGRLLGQRPAQAEGAGIQSSAPANSFAQAVVQRLVARATEDTHHEPHRGGRVSGDLRKRTEAELGRRLRTLLQQAEFRRVTASWFATEMVVRACPDTARTRFSTVDAAWEDIAGAAGGLEGLLAEGVSLLVVDHSFGPTAEELRALVALVRVCQQHDVFLATGATPSLAGRDGGVGSASAMSAPTTTEWQSDWSDEARQAWAELGPLREAGAQFALVLPRCLVRQPYGSRGEPLERLEFEELGTRSEPSDFLWANGAYLVAQALMEQWCGGQPHLDGSYVLKGLPVVTVADGEGVRLQAPLEAVLPSASVEELLHQGFSVIEAVQHSDRVRVHI